MDLPSMDLVSLLFRLLPGFLAAMVFHALTPYPRRDVFDRVVAALIFTLFAQIAVGSIRSVLLWIGANVVAIGEWSETVELAWGAALGLVMGFAWAHAVTKGWTHTLARKLGTTKKTSLPTQWFSAFSSYERFIILHFTDERRLMGWPLQWPDEPGSGHFVLERPAWVDKDGRKATMHQIEALLVSAKDIEAIEFLRYNDDPSLTENAKEIESAAKVLAEMRTGATHGTAGQVGKSDRAEGDEPVDQ